MIIQNLYVAGLFGTPRTIEIEFNRDLNILTGKNGSGKTTILKLLWYCISGNIEHALLEIPFAAVRVKTDEYSLAINRSAKAGEEITLSLGDEEIRFGRAEEDDFESDPVGDANNAVMEHGASLFFPTFRRIEGGFTIRSGSRNRFIQAARPARSPAPLEEALADLSRRLTVGRHTFVASISTLDIVQLVMKQYTDMSERVNNTQKQTSQKIIDEIKSHKREKGAHWSDPEKVLDDIRDMIEQLDGQRDEILAPLSAVRTLAMQLVQHAGINLGGRLSFGDAANAVNSETLSAGEKQMLSFICYNAFYKDSALFIDEPELSLHVDWQRQLFSIMNSQGTGNQFIVATHSPFIYGRFPEKEILVGGDRGDGEE